LFMLSLFEVPKGVLEKIGYYRSRFLWQNDNHKKKIHTSKMEYTMPTKKSRGNGYNKY
jgi:hypothetical protein